jgi:hypothetical protein
MNLLEVRHLFVDISGREDLASTTGASPHDKDTGADMFINAGLRQLDLWQDIPNKISLQQELIPAGIPDVHIANCRGIESVWIGNDEGYWELDEWTMRRYLQEYDSTAGDILAFAKYSVAGDPSLIGLKFIPPSEEDVTLSIFGHFCTPALVNNVDSNYWSTNYGLTLVHTALFVLEGTYRNSEGAKDWKAMIFEVLDGIDKDAAAIEMPTGKLVMGRG